MTDATFRQAKQILTIIEQTEAPRDQVQAVIDSGLLTDLLCADVAVIDRNAYREAIGLQRRRPKLFRVPVENGKLTFATLKKGFDVVDPIFAEQMNEFTPWPRDSKLNAAARVCVCTFGHSVDLDEVKRVAAKDNLCLAMPRVGLGYAKLYPDATRNGVVIVAGHDFPGRFLRNVMMMSSRDGVNSELGLADAQAEFRAGTKFLLASA